MPSQQDLELSPVGGAEEGGSFISALSVVAAPYILLLHSLGFS